jgi:hypothetical protein
MKSRLITSLFIFFVFFVSVQGVSAYDYHAPEIGASYNNQIISDTEFRAKDTMTEAQIQQFLIDKGSTLANYTIPTNGSVLTMIGWNWTVEAKGWSAAKVIYMSAQWYEINPQVLLATLQKESSLVTSGTLVNLGSAMGYGCPETDGCSTYYAGFAMQMDGAAYQFYYNMKYSDLKDSSRVYQYYAGNTTIIDGKNTYISNSATASLYRYTPHRPDSAWLDINGVNYYGNYNFIYYFNKWFQNWELTVIEKYFSNTNEWIIDSIKQLDKGDYNGDGKDDLMAMYDYGNGSMGIWTFTSDGTGFAPKLSYMTNANQWGVAATKFMVAGDYNGDGKDDLAILYDYGTNKAGIWLYISNGTTFLPKMSYYSMDWNSKSTRLMLLTRNNILKNANEIVTLYDYKKGNMGFLGFRQK